MSRGIMAPINHWRVAMTGNHGDGQSVAMAEEEGRHGAHQLTDRYLNLLSRSQSL